ncbi:MAG TPA: SPFH domain-containing protein [Albitalea sp.]|uniref:SPFH domain-containing protein n=1 Tax=Piscinibacter sp. TaxID=1903157 RepID=UPI002ED3B91D
MSRLSALSQAIRNAFDSSTRNLAGAAQAAGTGLFNARRFIVSALVVSAIGYAAYKHPPMHRVERGETGIRTNHLTGGVDQFGEGAVLVLPGVHELRRYVMRDQVYRPGQSGKGAGDAPFQSVEGLSIGVDLSVRYALDPARVRAMARSLPDDLNGEIVEPAVQSVIYKVFTRYTVREIFSSKRAEIQQAIEGELKPKLAADGILLRSVQMGKIDLPVDYRNGMNRLLAEELETEKMRYTLELKDKRVKETALDAEAEKVRREKAAEAAANEQIIAARAQEEAMRHVLPFKQKQIEQRKLEAEAEKLSRIKTAEGSAQARRIEASGEADSRQKLADAEAYRLERVGKIASDQMERDGALITRHPLLIQKTLADKLSDKITVIVAPPPANGGFIGASLLGATPQVANSRTPAADVAAKEAE